MMYYSRCGDRTPDFVDPPVQPAKLFRVQRIRPFKGNPYWEKRLLQELGLDGKNSDYTVVKNTPENNARLWKIKHLISVTPITFPFGEPTETDLNHTILKENGECVVIKQISGVVQDRLKALEDFEHSSKRLDTDLLRKDARNKWLNAW